MDFLLIYPFNSSQPEFMTPVISRFWYLTAPCLPIACVAEWVPKNLLRMGDTRLAISSKVFDTACSLGEQVEAADRQTSVKLRIPADTGQCHRVQP